MTKPWTHQTRLYAPSWMVIGVSFLLMVVVIVLGYLNYNREKATMGTLLNEKGAALIRSFEAGARTGMMGHLGNEVRLQTLMEQTASQLDLVYVLLSDKKGYILAHNEALRIGQVDSSFRVHGAFSPSEVPQWRMVKGVNQETIFEVYKLFLPVAQSDQGMGGAMHGQMHNKAKGRNRSPLWCAPGWMDNMPEKQILDPENRPTIIIGMDATPFEQAMAEDLRVNVVILVVIFLLSVTGVVTLFWVQSLITSRKLLQDTQAFASEIVANLPVGIVVVGDTRRIVYINGVARHLLNIKDSQGLGYDADAVLPPSILQQHHEKGPDKAVVEQEISLDGEGGGSIPVTVSVTDVINAEKRPLGFMVVLKDLSDLRSLEKEIQRREKLSAIGNLAAGVAHEVRNPLSSIKGFAAYLGGLFDPGSEQRKAADIMGEEVDRVNRVISELLEFARPSDLERKPTQIHDLLDHGVKLVNHEARSKGIEIRTDIAAGIPSVILDRDRMTQVLLNLMINAIEAMDEGGQLMVRAYLSDQHLVLAVTDTGLGIGDEDLAHIFNPYFTRKKTGTGLGLAIVVKIVENHGGSVRVQSKEGEGTTVFVSLPFIDAKEDS